MFLVLLRPSRRRVPRACGEWVLLLKEDFCGFRSRVRAEKSGLAVCGAGLPRPGAAGLVLCYALRDLIPPFLVAAMIAMTLTPEVDRLERQGLFGGASRAALRSG